MRNVFVIKEDTELAKVVFDGTSKDLGIYVYGEVYVPYSLYEKYEDMIKQLEVDAYGVDGEGTSTETSLKKVVKGSLGSFIKDFSEIPPSENIHEEVADLMGLVMEEDVKKFELTRLLWEVHKLKSKFTEDVTIGNDLVIDNVEIDGERVSLRFPEGTQVTVDKGHSYLKDIKINFNYIK